jgi:hypothetical protein
MAELAAKLEHLRHARDALPYLVARHAAIAR